MEISDMNLQDLRSSLRIFFDYTTVKDVRVVDQIPGYLDKRVSDEVADRKRFVWLDARGEDVCIYAPNMDTFNVGFLRSHILSAALEGYGVNGLFRKGVRNSPLFDPLRTFTGLFFDKGGVFTSVPRDRVFSVEKVLLEAAKDNALGMSFWERCGNAFSSYLGLDLESWRSGRSVRTGMENYLASRRDLGLDDSFSRDYFDLRLHDLRTSLGRFFECSRIKDLRVTDQLPGDVGLKKALLARKRCSWVDRDGSTVCIYSPNVRGFDRSFWQGQVIYAAIEKYGFSKLFSSPENPGICTFRDVDGRDAWKSFFSQGLYTDIDDRSPEGVDKLFLKAVEDSYSDDQFWRLGAGVLASTLGLDHDLFHLNNGFKRGFRSHFFVVKFEQEKAERGFTVGGQPEVSAVGSGFAERFLDPDSRGGKSVYDCGVVSDAYKRVGYPELHMMVEYKLLEMLFNRYGIDRESVEGMDIVSKLKDPLVIMQNQVDKGKYMAVVDCPFTGLAACPGNAYLAFTLLSPEEMVRKDALKMESGNRHSCMFPYPLILSEKQIAYNLSFSGNWKYMKPKDGPDGTDYVYVDRMKKGGTAASPALSSPVPDQRSLIAANIAINFRNPMSGDKFKKFFGYERDALRDEACRRAALAAELKATAPQKVRPMEVKETVVDKLDVRFPDGLVTDRSASLLREAGVKTARDVMGLGFERVREIVGNDRAVNQIASWMAERNIFIFPKNVQVLSHGRPSADAVMSHLNDSMMRFGSSVMTDMVLPRRLSGGFFSGADAVHLMISPVSRKARSCPFWVSESELKDIGCRIGKAEPVPVMNGGKPVNLYNLSETEFPKRYEDEYLSLMVSASKSAAADVEHSRFFGVLFGSISGNPVKESLVDWWNNSTAGAFDRLRTGFSESLTSVVGNERMQEMLRHGKTLKMFDSVASANERVRSKSKFR